MAPVVLCAGKVSVSQNEHLVLGIYGEWAGAAYDQESTWTVHPIATGVGEFALIYDKEGQELALTMRTVPDKPGAYWIRGKPLQSPPSKEQSWTIRDGRVVCSDSQILSITGRFQSVARNDYSVAIEGEMGTPYKAVACFPNSSGKNTTWTFHYIPPK